MTEQATRTSTTSQRVGPARAIALGMRSRRGATLLLVLALASAAGCAAKPDPYGKEELTWAPRRGPKTFAVTPALNLSGQRTPDPLLQADIVYQELQQVRGLTVVPVNRAVQAMVGLELRQVESTEQAYALCDALGVEALLVPTITAFDPYDPPKFGGSVQIFVRGGSGGAAAVDVRELSRRPTGGVESMPRDADFIQAVRMYDAAAGSTRMRVEQYAAGRNDPAGPLGVREYYVSMEKYSAFAWHELITEALKQFKD